MLSVKVPPNEKAPQLLLVGNREEAFLECGFHNYYKNLDENHLISHIQRSVVV
jgi:hypothetical protein